MVRAHTLVEPPGSAVSGVLVPTRPFAASFTVPSPPKATTTSYPSLAASRQIRVAWSRFSVSIASTE